MIFTQEQSQENSWIQQANILKRIGCDSNQEKQFCANTTQHSREASLSRKLTYHDDERDYLHLENETENILWKQTNSSAHPSSSPHNSISICGVVKANVFATWEKLNGWVTRRLFNSIASVWIILGSWLYQFTQLNPLCTRN